MDPVAETIAFYDRIASDYAQTWFDLSIMEEQSKYFVDHLIGDRVLDAGCGPGRDALFFTQQGLSVVGIDLSEELLAIARARVQGATFLKMDMRRLELPNQCCDGVWACASLLHIPHAQALQTLREFFRILEPNVGLLYVSVKEGRGEGWRDHPEGKTFSAYYTEDSFRRIIERAGFEIFRLKRVVGHKVFLEAFARPFV